MQDVPPQELRALAAELKTLVRGEVSFDPATRALYSTAACIYRVRPLGVVAPLDANDVAATVRLCRDHDIPITPRGSGSGLAGQALGRGIVLDFTVHMDRLLEVTDDSAWVEPGLICDDLNAAIAERGVTFPPDPSSSGYCSLGGMIANNSAGSHSVKYGTTIDWVDEVRVLLTSGDVVHLRPMPLDGAEWQQVQAEDSVEAALHRDVRRLVEENADLIRDRQPRTTKNACGYRLERVIEDGSINLTRLLCGSEGTLGIVLAAKLRLAPLPGARRLALVHFRDLPAAGRAVLEVLEMEPSAIEIHEPNAIEVIRQGRPELNDLLPAPGQTHLFVEFDGPDAAAVEAKLSRMRTRLCDELGIALRTIEPATAAETQRLWAIRKATLPLLYNRPGAKRIISFVEDVTVPTDTIPQYIDGLFEIFDRHGVEAALFGHAAQGNFHTRPFLNLHEPADVEKMRAIGDEVFDFTIALGGTISGEHGDGIARTEHLEKIYGPLVEVFAETKRLFDPLGILNPGKKVHDPALGYTMTSHLRFDTDYGSHPMSERLGWDDGGSAAEAERCHGCATCRTLPVAATRMCPVYKATGLEAAAPRAKANLLREIAAGRLDGTDAIAGLEQVADLCVLCGSCKVDCPSNVDVPKLMVEAKARIAEEGGRKLWKWLFARLDTLSGLIAPLAPVVNALNRLAPSRWLMEKVAHIDRRRPLPSIAWRTLRQRLRRRPPSGRGPSGRRAAYFPDVFAAYNEPALGEAVVALLESAGAHVEVPRLRGCGILALCYGDPDLARRTVRYNLDTLADLVHQGYDIVVSEPTALLCLRESYADLVVDARVAEVAAHSYDACSYLLELRRNGEFDAELAPVPLRLGHHTPCHARAIGLGKVTLDLLALIPELTVEAVEAGCCGIAGSAGVRSDKYDLSMQIGADLFERLADGRFDGAVTPCSTCRMQIEHGTRQTCWHPLHLLAHSALGTPLPKRL